MTQFLAAHWLDFLVILLLAVPVGFSIRNLLPGRHHAACAGCPGGCSGCSGCAHCAQAKTCAACPGKSRNNS